MRLHAYAPVAWSSVFAIALAAACGTSGDSTFVTPDAGPDGTSGEGGPVVCAQGRTACNGVCIDPTTDVANCGSCGRACGGGPNGKCCAGVCVLDTGSCGFALHDLDRTEGPVNGGDYLTLKGTGFVKGKLVVTIGDATAPARVLDASTAIVQTPPGPVGFADVTIAQPPVLSTLPKAYLYVTAGIQLPWTEKPMASVRGEDPGLAVMQDGRVLIVGGTTVPDDATKAMDSAEIYTRKTDSVSPAKNKMSVIRWHSSAVTLLDKRVLVVGGAAPSTAADLFDPQTDTFSPTPKPLTTARSYTRSVLMTDGRVMIASQGEQTAEIYDPDLGSFSQVPTQALHTFGFMVRLRDGRVMLGGGEIPGGAGTVGQTVVEIFDPGTSTFVKVAPLNQGRTMLTAHVLPDGRVMVIGGASESAGNIRVPLDTVEVYDPSANTWTVAPYKLHGGDAPNTGRTWHASALVRDGTVLVMGGYNVNQSCNPTSATVDQIDPIKNTSVPFGTLPHPNTEWTAVTLQDGSVLGVGGGACGTATALPSLDFLPGTPGTH